MEQYSILVVDDQLENLETMINFLKGARSNYKIMKAPNGKIACEIAEKKNPDLIITDWDMPVMNGIEAIKWLKNNNKTKDIPIIVASGAMTLAENVKTALEVGAVDYIKKPVDKIELSARVNSMLKLSISHKKIKEQSNQIEKNHRRITDSINYASRIQSAILPDFKLFDDYFSDFFIFYKPRNVVSGDFYWAKKVNENIIIAAADCTGHGVPGAFVSMLGISFLNEIVQKDDVKTAAQVLEELRIQIKTSLKQTGEALGSSDGMDIALCVINPKTKILQFSGAYNPLYIIRDNELIEIRATRNPIGVFIREIPFKNNEIQLQNNDILYLFSDGYADQFGIDAKKFLNKRFKELLLSIKDENMQKQKQILEKTYNDWKGNGVQMDDVLVMGVKI